MVIEAALARETFSDLFAACLPPGMSVVAYAATLGVNATTIHRLRNGTTTRTHPSTLSKLAKMKINGEPVDPARISRALAWTRKIRAALDSV